MAGMGTVHGHKLRTFCKERSEPKTGFPLDPIVVELMDQLSMGNLSNAFLNLSIIASTWPWLFSVVAQSCTAMISCVSHENTARKPCCRGVMMLLAFKCL